MALVRFPRGHQQRDLSTLPEAGSNGAHFNGITQSCACSMATSNMVEQVGFWGVKTWYNMV